jgi:hypothetical protein
MPVKPDFKNERMARIVCRYSIGFCGYYVGFGTSSTAGCSGNHPHMNLLNGMITMAFSLTTTVIIMLVIFRQIHLRNQEGPPAISMQR